MKSLKVTKIVKEIRFEGVWVELEAKNFFQRQSSLVLIIVLRFTCGERKIWKNIRKSQNIMKMIVAAVLQLNFTEQFL